MLTNQRCRSSNNHEFRRNHRHQTLAGAYRFSGLRKIRGDAAAGRRNCRLGRAWPRVGYGYAAQPENKPRFIG